MITSAGQRLGERYVLEDRLAVGGMGEVWRGRDELLNRAVAVKVLRLDLAPDEAFKARFRAEARTAAGLSHGGIAAVYDYGEALGSAYLVMELVPGEPLSAMISREGALGTDRTLQIVSQAARALHAAHRHGVIHRDVKPANLMVTPELRVKVTDFGIARPRDHEPLTATGQVMGTAHYLAPELARGEVATPLSDVYALGVVTYECLAGWRPFDGDNQVEVATAHLTDEPPPLPQTVPAPVRALVQQAMAKDPRQRPAGAAAFAAALEDLRLQRLAGHTAAAAAWPADAATPPRGVPTARDGVRRVGVRSGAAALPPPAPGSGGGPATSTLDHRRAGRRPSGKVLAAALLATTLVLAAGAVAVQRFDLGGIGRIRAAADPAASPTATSTATASGDGEYRTTDPDATTGVVLVRPRSLTGRDQDYVTGWLADRGLRWRVREVASSRAEGTVVRVSPSGQLERGTTVTVTVSRGPGTSDDATGDGDGGDR